MVTQRQARFIEWTEGCILIGDSAKGDLNSFYENQKDWHYGHYDASCYPIETPLYSTKSHFCRLLKRYFAELGTVSFTEDGLSVKGAELDPVEVHAAQVTDYDTDYDYLHENPDVAAEICFEVLESIEQYMSEAKKKLPI